MLEKKKISSKINYEVLRDLNSRGTGSGGGSSPTGVTSDPPNTAAATRKRLTRRRRKKTSDANRELAATTSIMGKRYSTKRIMYIYLHIYIHIEMDGKIICSSCWSQGTTHSILHTEEEENNRPGEQPHLSHLLPRYCGIYIYIYLYISL